MLLIDTPFPPHFARHPLPASRGEGNARLRRSQSPFALLQTSGALAAGNLSAGRQKAIACQTCHGLDGLSKMPDAPNIAGNPEPYLVRQLNAFKKGERKNEMMSVVVQQMSDQDIEDLSAYYAAIEVTVKVPPR